MYTSLDPTRLSMSRCYGRIEGFSTSMAANVFTTLLRKDGQLAPSPAGMVTRKW